MFQLKCNARSDFLNKYFQFQMSASFDNFCRTFETMYGCDRTECNNCSINLIEYGKMMIEFEMESD